MAPERSKLRGGGTAWPVTSARRNGVELLKPYDSYSHLPKRSVDLGNTAELEVLRRFIRGGNETHRNGAREPLHSFAEKRVVFRF
jgi:hypothetical protein